MPIGRARLLVRVPPGVFGYCVSREAAPSLIGQTKYVQASYREDMSRKIIKRLMKQERALMGGFELEQYAKLHDCDVKMVRRNLQLLRELGVALYVDREEGNYYVW